MWKVKMFSGQEFALNDNEARAVIAAMNQKTSVNLGYAVLNASGIESVVNEEQAKLKTNRIINDQDFLGWVEGDMRKLDALNSRYSGDKYEAEWKEALNHKKALLDQKQLT